MDSKRSILNKQGKCRGKLREIIVKNLVHFPCLKPIWSNKSKIRYIVRPITTCGPMPGTSNAAPKRLKTCLVSNDSAVSWVKTNLILLRV
ncbi:MAG: hypothetical protein CFE24_00535 [Flavobacterium sp. BFFFF2]|nr:MAG: hypothetical protein CFE24_00535 [Flavobacterium sp. BFFFF2]